MAPRGSFRRSFSIRTRTILTGMCVQSSYLPSRFFLWRGWRRRIVSRRPTGQLQPANLVRVIPLQGQANDGGASRAHVAAGRATTIAFPDASPKPAGFCLLLIQPGGQGGTSQSEPPDLPLIVSRRIETEISVGSMLMVAEPVFNKMLVHGVRSLDCG